MDRTAAAIVEQAGVYAASFDGGPAGAADGSSALPIRLAADQALLAGLERVSRRVRLAEAERVRIAGEIARRSAVEDPVSLAKRMGTASGPALVAERAILSRKAALDLVGLGEALRPRESLAGELMDPEHPHLSSAVERGAVPVTVAKAILRVLAKVGDKVKGEAARGDQLFPHLYAPITLATVIAYSPLAHEPDGSIRLPVAG